jgi:hypothetical protein
MSVRLSILVTAAFASLVAVNSVSAQVFYATGFENNTTGTVNAGPFTPGDFTGREVPLNLTGQQNGWLRDSNANDANGASARWQITNTNNSTHVSPFGAGTQSIIASGIDTSIPHFGPFTASYTYLAGTGPGGSGGISQLANLVANNRHLVTIRFDVFVQENGNSSAAYGFELFDPNGVQLITVGRTLANSQAATPGIYASNNGVNSVVGTGADSGFWMRFTINANFITGLYTIDTEALSVGGTQSVGPFAITAGGIDTLDNGGFLVFNWTQGGNIGTAFFDNLVISAVPEPASVVILGLAGLFVMTRRHRQN